MVLKVGKVFVIMGSTEKGDSEMNADEDRYFKSVEMKELDKIDLEIAIDELGEEEYEDEEEARIDRAIEMRDDMRADHAFDRDNMDW